MAGYFPMDCKLCEGINAHLYRGIPELDLKPIRGVAPSVLLVGQDPTISRGEIFSVLDLDNPGGNLYKYIVGDILGPARIELEDVYATDLVKCRLPDNQTPRKIAEEHHMTIKEFLDPFYQNCRQWFLGEICEIRPRLILSFGEPVHQLLIEEFSWPVPLEMKAAFSNAYEVDLFYGKASYFPCVHIVTASTRHYRALWNRFLKNLGETASRMAVDETFVSYVE